MDATRPFPWTEVPGYDHLQEIHYDCSIMFRRQDREHAIMIVLWDSDVTKILSGARYGENQ
jgi:hypothetical protein